MLKHIFKSVLFSLFILIQAHAIICADFGEFKTYNGHYYAVTSGLTDYISAKTYAEANGGYLAIPDSDGENTFIAGLIGQNKEAWIGVWDPNSIDNYCYTYECSTRYDRGRFLTIKNTAIVFSKWDNSDISNWVSDKDLEMVSTSTGTRQLISNPGEYYVLESGTTGLWRDFGSHYNNPSPQYKAVIEFDTKPICFTEATPYTEDITGRKCNTQVKDTSVVGGSSALVDCKIDSKGNEYCPSQLAACGQQWDYDQGYSVGTQTTTINYTPVIKDLIPDQYFTFGTSYSMCNDHYLSVFVVYVPSRNMLQMLYSNASPGLRLAWNCSYATKLQNVQITFDASKAFKANVYSYAGGCETKSFETTFQNLPVASRELSESEMIQWAQDRGVMSSYYMYGGSNDYYKFNIAYCPGKGAQYPIVLFQAKSCPSTHPYATGDGRCYDKKCPTGYELKNDTCSQTIDYSYYEYKCKDDLNTQGYNYQISSTGSTNCISNSTYNATQTYSCPNGGTLSGTTCSTASYSYEAEQTPMCSQDDSTLANGLCYDPYSYASTIEYSCPNGGTVSGSICTIVSTYTASTVYSCPSGGVLSGTTCNVPETSYSASIGGYQCPYGGSLKSDGVTCQYTQSYTPTIPGNYCRHINNGSPSSVLKNGYIQTSYFRFWYNDQCWAYGPVDMHFNSWTSGSGTTSSYPVAPGNRISSTNHSGTVNPTNGSNQLYTCPDGGAVVGNNCVKTIEYAANPYYACPNGGTLSGTNCIKAPYSYNATGALTCINGGTLSGTTCTKTETYTGTRNDLCPEGGSFDGTVCQNYHTTTPVAQYNCPNGGTLSGATCNVASYSYTATSAYICPNGGSLSGTICTANNSSSSLIDTNGDGIGDSCNSSTPPVNNCKREKFTCQASADRPCALVNNVWQCSPFPCFGNSDLSLEGSVQGSNDTNNAGWTQDGECAGKINIFPGKDLRCRSWDSFSSIGGGQCCGSEDSMIFGLTDCNDDEKMLAKKKDGELCKEIGEYCSKKIKLGFAKICVQKKKSYCCFNSKLGKAIVEQGKPQLGRGFGSAENPDCKGFAIEDFEKLDFSKMDLSGAFDLPSASDASGIVSGLKNLGNNTGN